MDIPGLRTRGNRRKGMIEVVCEGCGQTYKMRVTTFYNIGTLGLGYCAIVQEKVGMYKVRVN